MEERTDAVTLTMQVRAFADTLDAGGRGRLLYEPVRTVSDSEKFTGLGGGGLDGRHTAARASSRVFLTLHSEPGTRSLICRRRRECCWPHCRKHPPGVG